MLSTLGRLDEAAGDRKGVPNFLSTHPEPLARVQEIRADGGEGSRRASRASSPIAPPSAPQVDGVIFGDNPAQGIVRGTTFLHPPLRFRLDFPAGWQVANSPQQVVAKAPNADVFVVLQLVPKPQGASVEDIGVASMQKAGFRLVRGERTTIDGLDAHVGEYQGQIEGLGEVRSRAAHIAPRRQRLHDRGPRGAGALRAGRRRVRDEPLSFRPLSASEAEASGRARIDLYTVRARATPGRRWPAGRRAP